MKNNKHTQSCSNLSKLVLSYEHETSDLESTTVFPRSPCSEFYN